LCNKVKEIVWTWNVSGNSCQILVENQKERNLKWGKNVIKVDLKTYDMNVIR